MFLYSIEVFCKKMFIPSPFPLKEYFSTFLKHYRVNDIHK
ncbi:Hypothetical protein BN2458_PEG0843 [Helicobacter typhlonius]|uniref:Uncharacterized protein n=1 Tax=Helicobacter typhlonius TaxID=76936 RepID=A0A0S4PUK8_9HELI|nr:Hypothetical protein BN2458_PEG0843 [Helicobacter typhlonius]